MELDVSKAFLNPTATFPFEAEVSLSPQDVCGDTVTFDPVAMKGVYLTVDDTVRLEGTLQTVAHGTCAMCLERADAPIKVEFAETFRKDANEMEDEFFRYEGKVVKLDHMTLTLVMLNLPMSFECKPGCGGSSDLQAWRNENTQSTFEETRQRNPFEALQSLFNKDEEV